MFMADEAGAGAGAADDKGAGAAAADASKGADGGAGGQGAGAGDAGKGGAADAGKGQDGGKAADGTIASQGADKQEDLGKGKLEELRDLLAGGDEGMKKALERYKSTEAIAKAAREWRQGAKEAAAGKTVALKEGASDAEIAAFREANGIPPEAKDYPGDFRAEFKPTDGDKQLLGEFKSAMHSKNVPPTAAAAALEWYQDFATIQQQERDGRMARREAETTAALKSEWGGDYKGNIAAANHIMAQIAGDDGAEEILGLRLEDGSRLQDNKTFVKMMAQLGGDYFGGTAIIKGDIETTSRSIDEQIADGMKLLNGTAADREKYNSPAHQQHMAKLYDQKAKLAKR